MPNFIHYVNIIILNKILIRTYSISCKKPLKSLIFEKIKLSNLIDVVAR